VLRELSRFTALLVPGDEDGPPLDGHLAVRQQQAVVQLDARATQLGDPALAYQLAVLDADLPPVVQLDVHENVARERQVRQCVAKECPAHVLEEFVVDGLVDMAQCVQVPLAQRQLDSNRRHGLSHRRGR
jgi:hypothetical protein